MGQFKPKVRGSGKPQGAYLKGAPGEGTERQGKLLITRAVEDSYQELLSACDCRLLSRVCACMKDQCQFKVPAGRWAKQNGWQGRSTME